MSTGTGRAHPMSGTPVANATSGKSTVPTGSMCTSRPPSGTSRLKCRCGTDSLTPVRPNVPTTVEKGHPELNLKVWVGFFAPANQGSNPPNGVVVHYSLAGVAEGTKVTMEFLDAGGNSLRTFEGDAGWVNSVAIHPDGQRVYMITNKGANLVRLVLFDVQQDQKDGVAALLAGDRSAAVRANAGSRTVNPASRRVWPVRRSTRCGFFPE